MFGKAEGHKVIKPEEAVTDLRNQFDESIKAGHLRTENIESVLVDIRQAMNNCDQTKNKILREADTLIKDLIKTLYERKEALVVQINEYFET